MLTGSQGHDQVFLFPPWELEMVPPRARHHYGRMPALEWLSAEAYLRYFSLLGNVLGTK